MLPNLAIFAKGLWPNFTSKQIKHNEKKIGKKIRSKLYKKSLTSSKFNCTYSLHILIIYLTLLYVNMCGSDGIKNIKSKENHQAEAKNYCDVADRHGPPPAHMHAALHWL